MAWKITLPQTDCREGSPRCPFSSGSSVSSGSSGGQLRLTMRSIGMRFTQFLLVGHLRLDGSSESLSRRVAPSRWQLRLVMCSICMRYRQLLLVGQLSLKGSSESASQGIITSGSVLSKTAIFPKKERRKGWTATGPSALCLVGRPVTRAKMWQVSSAHQGRAFLCTTAQCCAHSCCRR